MPKIIRKDFPQLPPTFVIREWSVKIQCDPRSIEKEIVSPGSVRGLAGERIRNALPALLAAVRP